MHFTNPEKLILNLLIDLRKKMGVADEDDAFIERAIFTENTWALSWHFQSIVGSEPDDTPREVSFVSKVMTMWDVIELSIDALPKVEREQIQNNYPHDHRFSGFDGHSEARYLNIALFFVDDFHRYSRFKGRELDSLVSREHKYQNMLQLYDTYTSITFKGLSVDQIESLLGS